MVLLLFHQQQFAIYGHSEPDGRMPLRKAFGSCFLENGPDDFAAFSGQGAGPLFSGGSSSGETKLHSSFKYVVECLIEALKGHQLT